MKSKKIFAGLLAIIMIFAISVTSFAEVMNVKTFYDKEANILYYVGRIASTDTDAGIEINGTKYSLNTETEPKKLEIAKAMDGNFAIGFSNPEKIDKNYEIKPYAKNAKGETVYYGEVLSYDPDAVSDEAVLVSAAPESGILVPAFSSEVYEYVVGIANADKLPKISYEQAEGYTAEISEAETIEDSTVVTVYDLEGKTRTYTFSYMVVSPINDKVTVNLDNSFVVTADTRTKKIEWASGNYNPADKADKLIFFKDKKDSNIPSGKYNLGVFTFDLSEVTVDEFGSYKVEFTFGGTQQHQQSTPVVQEEFEISAFAVYNNNMTRDTATEETVKKSTLKVGGIVGTTYVDKVEGDEKFEIDVTDYVRTELIKLNKKNDGNKKISIGLSVSGLKTLNDQYVEYVRVYNNGSTTGRTPKLYCSSLGMSANLESAGISEDAKAEGNIFLPTFDKAVKVYYIGVPAGKSIPEVNFVAEAGTVAEVVSEASKVGEETIISVTSEGGLVKDTYKFIYENITTTSKSTLRAVKSQNVKTNGTTSNISNYDRLSYYGSATNNNNLSSIMRFDIPANSSKYDNFAVYLRTNGSILGNKNKQTDLTVEFTKINWNGTWERADAGTVLTDYTIGSSIATTTLTTKALNSNGNGWALNDVNIYCDVTDYVRDEIAKGNTYFNLYARVIGASDYDKEAAYVNVYQPTYGSSVTYGPAVVRSFDKGLATATIDSKKGILYPAFSNNVYDYEIVLSEADTELPEIAYTLKNTADSKAEVKYAENVGEATVISVTTYGKTVNYTFKYKNPYVGVSDKAAFTSKAVDSSTVQSAKPYSVYTANRDHIQVIKNYNETNPETNYAIIKFDFTNEDVNPFGKYELKLVERGANTALVGTTVYVKAANVVDNWTYESPVPEGSVAANYAYTLGAKDASIEESAVTTFSVVGISGTAHTLDISDIVKNRLLNNKKKFTLVLDFDLSTVKGAEDDQKLILSICNHLHSTEKNRPSITYYPAIEAE